MLLLLASFYSKRFSLPKGAGLVSAVWSKVGTGVVDDCIPAFDAAGMQSEWALPAIPGIVACLQFLMLASSSLSSGYMQLSMAFVSCWPSCHMPEAV